MKAKSLLFTLLTIISFSCNKEQSEKTEILNCFDESLANWQLLKGEHGESYQYQTSFTSWAGFGSRTEITVKEGVVIARNYEGFTIDGSTGAQSIVEEFHETQAELGTNQKGMPPATLDELYTSCTTDFLSVSINKNTLYFDKHETGRMERCGFVADGCADDCFQGFYISSFSWID